MKMNFDEANESILSENYKEYQKGWSNFNLIFKTICEDCINRNKCNAFSYGIAECDYFNKGV